MENFRPEELRAEKNQPPMIWRCKAVLAVEICSSYCHSQYGSDHEVLKMCILRYEAAHAAAGTTLPDPLTFPSVTALDLVVV